MIPGSESIDQDSIKYAENAIPETITSNKISDSLKFKNLVKVFMVSRYKLGDSKPKGTNYICTQQSRLRHFSPNIWLRKDPSTKSLIYKIENSTT